MIKKKFIRYTHLLTICPICKDDLVYLPKKLSQHKGGGSQLLITLRNINQKHIKAV